MTSEKQARYSVQAVGSMDNLRGIRQAWERLQANSQADNVFVTWQWLNAWSECFLDQDRTLFVLCVHDAGDLIAVAPWYIARSSRSGVTLREVRFLGTPEGGSDYLDIVAKQGKEKPAADALFDFLFGEGSGQWDVLRLTDLPSESLFLLHFANRVDEAGKLVEMKPCAFMPRVALASDQESFLQRLSGNRRYIYKRDARRLERETGYSHESLEGDRVDEGIDRFFHLYAAKSGYEDGPDHLALLRKLGTMPGAKDLVRTDFLVVGGRDVAALLHLSYGGDLSMLKMVVDKTFNRRVSVGNLLVGICILEAVEQGFRCYDFLKGVEPYKWHWARGGRSSFTLWLPNRRPQAMLAAAHDFAKRFGKAVLR